MLNTVIVNCNPVFPQIASVSGGTNKHVLSPVVSPGHALLVDGPVQLFGVGEDGLVVDDDGLDDLVDVGLTGHLVQAVRRGHQCGAEADGQVVGVHHVLVTVLGQAV